MLAVTQCIDTTRSMITFRNVAICVLSSQRKTSLPDTLNGWTTGSSVLAAVRSGRWRNLRGVSLARSAKAVAQDELRLSIQKRVSAYLGMVNLTATGSPQLTTTGSFTFQAFGYVGTPTASILTTSKNSDTLDKTNLRRL